MGARRARRLEALVAADETGRLRAQPLDIADAGSRESFLRAVLDRHGQCDVLINNAGVSGYSAAQDEPPETWARTFDVNVHGLFGLTQLVGRVMLDQGRGTVVNLASTLGLVASSPFDSASYSASKGAVLSLTRELAVQWARRGIRVNALAPGWFPTEMNAAAMQNESAMSYQKRNCPMGRWGREDELDGALLFLASDASSYLTGQTLVVDGGWTAR
jgi:NAD(P)-dependent dehydrogenase (short-subunit alcohol dehydrogenase family)